ncbi:RICIN domain-containing protein [Pedobacter sp. N36a]|uniref:RICIN domain-containing protein n=1 Tax=Pedobacter sp. N36a TaxID=2767996 RepID=UPI00351C5BEB
MKSLSPTSNNQKFLARKVGSAYVFKSVADTTKVLDVYAGSSVDGTKVQVYTFKNGNS